MPDVMAAVRAAVRGQEGDGNAASPGQLAGGPDGRPGQLLAGTAPSLAILLWGVITVVALATRPLLPVDETRYAAVAWEMWLRGDALVPYLNGVPYSHKPPLLFWLVEAGWLVGGGPSMLWARLVGPLCMALDLWLVHRLARRLWPERPEVARLAPLVLLATLLWAVYGTLLLFDALLTACVLVALLGLVELRDGGRRRGAALLALGVGSGILAKGPVVFIHLLPVLLLAPWWTRGASHPAGAFGPVEGDWPNGQQPVTGARWALWAGGAVVGGILLALLWAIPAGVAGGPAYQREIFLGQTTGRMVRSFAHRRPVWWYLPQLLWMLLPWWLWPALWRGVRRLAVGAGRPRDPGVRFCLAWSIPALGAFSLVSGKQVHYLIPELPALALLAARALLAPAPGPEAATGEAAAGRRGGGILLPVLALALPGLVLTMLVLMPGRLTLPPGLVLPPLWAALPLALAPPAIALVVGAAVGRGGAVGAAGAGSAGVASSVRGAMALAAASVALVAGVHLVAMPALAERYDLGPVSRHLGRLERAGVPLAHVGRYSGQFSLAGRIRRPLDVIDARDVGGWLALHPGGAVVRYETARPARTVDFAQRFGEGWWVVERGPGPSGP